MAPVTCWMLLDLGVLCIFFDFFSPNILKFFVKAGCTISAQGRWRNTASGTCYGEAFSLLSKYEFKVLHSSAQTLGLIPDLESHFFHSHVYPIVKDIHNVFLIINVVLTVHVKEIWDRYKEIKKNIYFSW